MAFAKFVVCEASNRWTVALRWGRAEDLMRLVVARDLDDCWAVLHDSPASFVAFALDDANLESIVERLQDLRDQFPLARAAVMCDRSMAACEWVVREAGAVHVAVSVRDMATLIRLAERHMAQLPKPDVGFRQSVWDRLAWQETQINSRTSTAAHQQPHINSSADAKQISFISIQAEGKERSCPQDR